MQTKTQYNSNLVNMVGLQTGLTTTEISVENSQGNSKFTIWPTPCHMSRELNIPLHKDVLSHVHGSFNSNS